MYFNFLARKLRQPLYHVAELLFISTKRLPPVSVSVAYNRIMKHNLLMHDIIALLYNIKLLRVVNIRYQFSLSGVDD